ncbi:MAG: sulfatase-like hydrolase/transferase, partial [Alistipes sp.]|nr:sulfatase-like hydrolase/transferase [Alistipes sp.]
MKPKTDTFIKSTIALTAALSSGILPGEAGQGEPVRTNFILINFDDAGLGDFSHTGAIGYSTPNIDRLASEGVRFTNFYAVQPISRATRAGQLTACSPHRLGFAYA